MTVKTGPWLKIHALKNCKLDHQSRWDGVSQPTYHRAKFKTSDAKKVKKKKCFKMMFVVDFLLTSQKQCKISGFKECQMLTWVLLFFFFPLPPPSFHDSGTKLGFSTLLTRPRSEWSTLMGFLIFNLINLVKIKAS